MNDDQITKLFILLESIESKLKSIDSKISEHNVKDVCDELELIKTKLDDIETNTSNLL